MKTNKSLLVKFLTVLCALCFSLSLVFGLVGCGEDVKSIVKTEIKNGELIVTYSDNTTANLGSVIGEAGKDGEDGEDGKDANACSHARLEVMTGASTLDAKYDDVCSVKVALCLDCQHVLIEKVEHNMVDVEAVAATCYSKGHEAGKECSECGYFTGGAIIDEIAHTPVSTFVAYNDPALSICIDGGFVVTYCEVCKNAGAYGDAVEGNELTVTFDETTGLGHSSTAWKKYEDPTFADTGLLIADICDECGTSNVTMEIPALNEVDYVKTTKVAKVQCTDTETYNYQLTVGAQTFDYEYVTAAGNHKISDTITFTDGMVYDYDPDLFTKFGNQEETCKAEGFDVFFTCQDCGQPIQTKAKVAHETVFENADNPATEAVELPEVATPATCEGFGYYKAYTCSDCGTLIDAPEALQFAKLGHEFVAYEIADEYADGTVKLVSECTRYADCGKVDVIDHAAATYEKVEATCEAEGSETWTVTEINGVALEEALVATKKLDKVAHKLGEEEIDLTKVYDWTVYEEKGLIGFGNVQYTCKDEGFDVFFYCASCNKPITVKAEVPHTVPADPNAETEVNEAITVVAPSCGVAGKESYNCSVCGDLVEKEIPALVHAYTYTMEIQGTNAIITGTCVNGDQHIVADPAKVVTYVVALADLSSVEKVVATCEVDGIITYSWSKDGQTLTADVNVGKTQHKLNGNYVDDTVVHYVGNGIVAMGNSTPACDSLVPGQGMFTCECCAKPISVMVKEAHTKPATGVVIVGADCENPGSETYVCAECGETIVNPINALGHINAYDYETLVKPSNTVAGEIKVVCTREGCGDVVATVVLPVLTSDEYEVTVVSVASCQTEGVTTYTYVDATYGAVTFNIVEGKTAHGFIQPPFTWEHNGYIYTGRICEDCNKIIVESKVLKPLA